MKSFAKFIFASTFALSALAPAFAAEEDLLLERNGKISSTESIVQSAAAKHVRAHRATDARAYVPADASVGEGVDFGIGSQR